MNARLPLAMLMSLAALGAFAQTPETTTPVSHPATRHTAAKAPAHAASPKTSSHAAATKEPPHPAATRPRHVPVVAPRHAGPPRLPTASASRKPVLKLAKKEVPPAKPALAKPVVPPLPADVGTVTGFHIPRYAALKSDDVNMRVGPAERYPVTWTYKRRDLPVRIEREFDAWRLVEDMDGVKGWVLAAMLTGRRSFVVMGSADLVLRADASESADAVATLKPGVVGRIKACDAAKAWCQVQVQSYRGWLRRSDIWGVDEGEAVTP